jgi:hypothetical protein
MLPTKPAIFFVGLGLELRASGLQSRYSSTWVKPSVSSTFRIHLPSVEHLECSHIVPCFFQRPLSPSVCIYLVCPFCFVCHRVSFCSPGWLQTHDPPRLPSARITGVYLYARLVGLFLPLFSKVFLLSRAQWIWPRVLWCLKEIRGRVC